MGLTPHEIRVLRILAITSACLSAIAGFFMLYWFAKLKKRSFRHQLVMVLVMADFLKAIVEIVYPAATLASGDTSSNALCTTTGFFSTLFVDVGDVIILVIAVHTALCIFKSDSANVAREEAGLYRWRHSVYAIVVVYPLTMTCLAFLNKNTAYTSSGSWCFLPIRPFYWRIALSWAPRYAILLSILGIYISIFIFVKRKFSSFHKMFATSGLDESTADDVLLMSDAHTTTAPANQNLDMTVLKTYGMVKSAQTTPGLESAVSPSIKTASQVNTLSSPTSMVFSLTDTPATGYVDYVPSQETHVASLTSQERRRATITSFTKPLVMSSHAKHESRETARQADPLHLERARIVKQLKHLFAFPCIYFLMWIIPFCFHMTQYTDDFLIHPNMTLAGLAAFIIPLHGFINVCVYARNEKPWRSWRYQKSRSKINRQMSSSMEMLQHGHDVSNMDMTDDVSRRRLQEIQEAEEKRDSRISASRPVSGVNLKEWWEDDQDIMGETDI